MDILPLVIMLPLYIQSAPAKILQQQQHPAPASHPHAADSTTLMLLLARSLGLWCTRQQGRLSWIAADQCEGATTELRHPQTGVVGAAPQLRGWGGDHPPVPISNACVEMICPTTGCKLAPQAEHVAPHKAMQFQGSLNCLHGAADT